MDTIVSAVSHEGDLFIFMRSGKIWLMRRDFSGRMQFSLQIDLVPKCE